MTSVMIYKELRETAGIAAIAMVAMLLLLTGQMGVSLLPMFSQAVRPIPFLNDDLYRSFVLLATAFTIAVGFRQTAWELWQGTFLFLLHRPVTRQRMIVTKLAIGLSVYLICTAVPLLLYAAWAATPGMHPSPFYWSMTYDIWQLWIAMSVVYLGALASGLLPGRWLGRRLLPLATAGAAAAAIANLPWWWFTGFPLLIVAYVVFVGTILHIAQQRDYA